MDKLKLILVMFVVSSLVIFLTGCGPKEQQGEIIQEGGEMEKSKIKPSSRAQVEGMENAKILMIIAPSNFRDEEFLGPKEVFEKNGLQVTVASKGVSEALGVLGARVKVDLDVSQVKVADYDGLVFVGGPGASVYFDDQTALSLAKAAIEQGKVVGAICIAPSILANAGTLEGKRATAFSSEANNLRGKGAEYTSEEVTVDGKIVTGNGPGAAKEFGEKIVDLLSK